MSTEATTRIRHRCVGAEAAGVVADPCAALDKETVPAAVAVDPLHMVITSRYEMSVFFNMSLTLFSLLPFLLINVFFSQAFKSLKRP